MANICNFGYKSFYFKPLHEVKKTKPKLMKKLLQESTLISEYVDHNCIC